MEGEKGAAATSARGPASSSFSASGFDPNASSSSHAPAEAPAREPSGDRWRFSVELRPGETTIVSWKRLVRDSNTANGEAAVPPAVPPVLEPSPAPAAAGQTVESEKQDAHAPPNRFSAVIEKIERLYTGGESSNEELDNFPDDDQYDTEDSFIDDTDLNEYFEVEKSLTKHNGFFVNRGALEQIERSSPAPDLTPKKRRKKDRISSKGGSHWANELTHAGNVRMKAAARSAPLGRKSSSPMKTSNFFANHYQEGKVLKSKMNASVEMYERESTDPAIISSDLPSVNVQNEDVLASSSGYKGVQDQRSSSVRSTDAANNIGKCGSFDSINPSTKDQSKMLTKAQVLRMYPTKSQYRNRNRIVELPDLNSPGNTYSMQGMKPTQLKEGSSIIRPKGTTLERAIRDLEKIVAACRPNLDVHECDASSQMAKKRLPQEVKQKLAKVARLAASQGKVKEEDLLDHLMGIVGHLVQRKTLKRNLKEMVELGLSAKQIKADRFQKIKKEVVEMIKMQMNSKTKDLEQQDGLSGDFQEITGEERRALRAKYNMDNAIEDKLGDLYNLYIEGMDEDKGPQMRKLYVELAELWPTGYMDNVGIKDAISRAKGRKKAIYRQQNQNGERIRRKKVFAAVRMEDNITLGLQTPAAQNMLDSKVQVLASAEKVIRPFPPSSGWMYERSTSLNGSSPRQGLKKFNKARGSSTETASDDAAASKKKPKRKLETGDNYAHSVKPSSYGKEKPCAPTPSEDKGRPTPIPTSRPR